MREIGGYFELDSGRGNSLLPDGVLLNSGRNALRHIVRQLKVESIWVPDYTCPVVWDALKAEKCELRFYSIGLDMLPAEKLPRNDFILYTNYFGCCGRNVERLAAEHPNLIVDCAQAYHATPKGRASFSSPRKFFGVPDGGIAYGVEWSDYAEDDSECRKMHLVERLNNGATSNGYRLYRAAEDSLGGTEVKVMSLWTQRALFHLNLNAACSRRRENFGCLHERLHSSFPFSLADDDVPMVYPLVTDDITMRSRLISRKIFVAKYWSGLSAKANSFAERILPLPMDQRYDEDDMRHIIEVIE